jgi:hypothetical protein
MSTTWLPDVEQRAPIVTRPLRLADRIVCVGGLPGCGKTMLTPIIGSLARVEVQKFNYLMEYVSELSLLGLLPESAATSFLRLLADLDLYNLTMCRETNLRPSDTSSIFRNPNTWQYLSRLVQAGDAVAAARIRQERPILHLAIHNALAISPPFFTALQDGFRLIEVVRHPLYMIKQWLAYIDRYGTDAREFTLWLDANGQPVPFFAHGWEEKYLSLNPMDRCIHSIAWLLEMGEQALDSLAPSARRQVMILPFERFVLEPGPLLEEIEQVLDTTSTPATRRELKRQRVPRAQVAAGRPLAIYKQYGWQPPEKGKSEREELDARRRFVESQATPEAMQVLDRLSQAYEARYWPEVRQD